MIQCVIDSSRFAVSDVLKRNNL